MAQYSNEIKLELLRSFYLSYSLQQKGLSINKITLDFIDLHLLNVLNEEPKSIKQLCTLTNLDRKEINKRITKQIKAGLIEKKTMEDDKRSSILVLKQEGKLAEKESSKKINQVLEITTSNLSLKEERSVLKYLKDLNDALTDVI